MTVLLDNHTSMPPYMIMPCFLLDMELNDAQRLVYILLLNRLRLSMRNPRFQDELGRPFVLYSISGLARDAKKSTTTVKHILRRLEALGLIARQHQGQGKPNRIYVKVKPAPQPPLGGPAYAAEPWETL